jgi:putative NADH-flavin reductase
VRVTVLGASGRTGRELVRQALAAGHEVTAFARDRSRLDPAYEPAAVVEGDATDRAAVSRAVAGADAVVSGLGPERDGDPRFMPRAAEAVVAAMEQHGVRRLVWLTGAGVKDPGDPASPVRAAIRALMAIVSRAALRSSDEAYRIVTRSGLDWTVARVPRLKDGPGEGPVRLVEAPPGPVQVARADVAAWMLGALEDPATIGTSPFLVR